MEVMLNDKEVMSVAEAIDILTSLSDKMPDINESMNIWALSQELTEVIAKYGRDE